MHRANNKVMYHQAGKFVTITQREHKHRDCGFWLGDEWVYNQRLPYNTQAQP